MNDPRNVVKGVEWNAASYHQLSDPQFIWGMSVLGRLTLRGDERAMDAGCGSGRLTEVLLSRLPRGEVLAVDRSANMIEQARKTLAVYGPRVTFLHADLESLVIAEPVEVIFSTATFHWIRDHDRLFHSLFTALRPGGRLHVQCGGLGNLERLDARARRLLSSPLLRQRVGSWTGPWLFAGPEETQARLRRAGFIDTEASLEQTPTILPDRDTYRDFLRVVIFRNHLERIGDPDAAEQFLETLTDLGAADTPPYLLDYVRLNFSGVRPA